MRVASGWFRVEGWADSYRRPATSHRQPASSSVAVVLRNCPTRERGYSDRPRPCLEARPVIDDEPLLVLPLMHHLVEQRVQRLLPTVSPNVAAAPNNLRLATIGCRTVVTQTAAHAA